MNARFWDFETCHVNRTHSVKKTHCEEMFNLTTTLDEEGRFVVSLSKRVPRNSHEAVHRLGEAARPERRTQGVIQGVYP